MNLGHAKPTSAFGFWEISSQALAAWQTPPQVVFAMPLWQPLTQFWLSHCFGGGRAYATGPALVDVPELADELPPAEFEPEEPLDPLVPLVPLDAAEEPPLLDFAALVLPFVPVLLASEGAAFEAQAPWRMTQERSKQVEKGGCKGGAPRAEGRRISPQYSWTGVTAQGNASARGGRGAELAPSAAMVSTVTFVALVLTGVAAGALGALVGIGGGVILVPALVLFFHVPPHAAVAASLVAVVATSTAAGSVYVGAGLANMRLGMALEIATTVGGALGGLVAVRVSPSVLAGSLSVLLVVTAVLLASRRERAEAGEDEGADAPRSRGRRAPLGWEEPGRLAGAYTDERTGRQVHYEARHWPLGAALSLLAGLVSGLLGVGGGFMKVPAMALGMGVPLRVAAATSNFMIGVTAISSLSVYLARGTVEPLLAAPGALGVVAGSLAGTRIAGKVPGGALRAIAAASLLLAAGELALRLVHHAGGGGAV
jgi:uncharacterized membrane protein YfcA